MALTTKYGNGALGLYAQADAKAKAEREARNGPALRQLERRERNKEKRRLAKQARRRKRILRGMLRHGCNK